eukprot:TRINITY_DN9704_c0_g1_i3.p1 TRINITY_DN9704_c0_g1~~TRINITY_DN9704_c0_g1_i3.p1  ORF type:complete len:127 (+),score=27.71 TRINITY_DN9704_c0_g1_i3:128-508(+)
MCIRDRAILAGMAPLQYAQFVVLQYAAEGHEHDGYGEHEWSYEELLELEHSCAQTGLSEEKRADLPRVHFSEGEESTCSICQESFKEAELLVRLPCEHMFHTGCVLKWMEAHTTCPLCRFDCDDEQ